MATKLETYKKEIKKFLSETYNMDVLKLQKPNGAIETFNDVYVINTSNHGFVRISLDMTRYFDKNKTYDIFTRKNYYEKVADGVYKIADNVGEKFNKLNCPSVDLVKWFIRSNYVPTK